MKRTAWQRAVDVLAVIGICIPAAIVGGWV